MKAKYYPKQWVQEVLCFLMFAVIIFGALAYQSNAVANEQKEKDLVETRSKTND